MNYLRFGIVGASVAVLLLVLFPVVVVAAGVLYAGGGTHLKEYRSA